jgi:hypothetical protein
MTVERGTAPLDFEPARRGRHGGGGRQRRTFGELTRLWLLVPALAALAGVVAVALFLPRPSGPSRLFPPIRAVVTPPTLVPRPPAAPPSEPPGSPSSIPTAAPTGPSQAPPQARPPLRAITIEAESSSNTLSGEARIRTVAGASGGQVIGSIGGGSANTLRFNGIVVPARGIYTLTVFYVSRVDRVAAIRVDGGVPVELTFPATGDWGTVGALTVRVEFLAGANTLEFGNPRDRAPAIDRIRVS